MAKTPTLLFLSSQPRDEETVKSSEEFRKIRSVFGEKGAFCCDVRYEPAISLSELSYLFEQFKPEIIHFSGHGMETGELVFQKGDGSGENADVESLADVFKSLKDHTKLVFLNSCYSETQAKAISKYLPVVIGMNNSVYDDSAIIFSEFFYYKFSRFYNIKESFNDARTHLDVNHGEESEIPIILPKRNTEAVNFILPRDTEKKSKYIFNSSIPKNTCELCNKLDSINRNIEIWYELIINQFSKLLRFNDEAKPISNGDTQNTFHFISRRELDEVSLDSKEFLFKISKHEKIKHMLIDVNVNPAQFEEIGILIEKFRKNVIEPKREMWMDLQSKKINQDMPAIVLAWFDELLHHKENIREKIKSIISKLE